METNPKACTQKLNSLNLPPEHAQFFLESLTPSLTEVVICGNIFTREGNMPGGKPPSGSAAVDPSFGHFYSDSRAVSPNRLQEVQRLHSLHSTHIKLRLNAQMRRRESIPSRL